MALTNVYSYQKALEMIAADALPCLICHEPHEYRPLKGGKWTWAHPDDGHNYMKMDVKAFVMRVLDGKMALT